jgi:glycosyltransferase involved in cell wall biosynthesis
LKVLQVSTADIASGAELVAMNLHLGLRRRGCRTWLVVGEKRSSVDGVIQFDNDAARRAWARFWIHLGQRSGRVLGDNRVGRRLRRLLGYRIGQPGRWWQVDRGWEDMDFPATAQLLDLTPERPDILHCNNLHGAYFDLRCLPALARQVPVVMTIHDFWPLTGHCGGPVDCTRWQIGCGQCPDLTLYPPLKRDNTAANYQRKRAIFSAARVHPICTSQWMRRCLETSPLASVAEQARVIHLGIDTAIFRPAPDRAAVRQQLNLPVDAAIVLFAASTGKKNPFKDYATIAAATRQVAERGVGKPLWFLLVGGEPTREQLGSATVFGVGHIHDRQTLAKCYQAADLFMHATLADTWGLTITEALGCGTPVVATQVGGIPEQVLDGQTGLLVPSRDAKAFADAVHHLLTDEPLRKRMSQEAVKLVQQRFELTRQIDQYLDAFHDIRATWLRQRSAAAPD